MAYMDVWMYNSRPRMRVLFCYFLIFVAFFVFSDAMIYGYTKSLYKTIENYEIQVNEPQVTITSAEASSANGTIKGTISNNTNEEIRNQYLKFDFYTPRDINVGTKYLKIDNLNPAQTKQYEMNFRYDNVTSVEVSKVEENDIIKDTPERLEVNPVIGPASLLSGILYLFL